MVANNHAMNHELEALEFETLELKIVDKVAVIYLDRPPVNTLNYTSFEELYRILVNIENDSSIKVLIVTGKGERAFAAGADISEMANLDAEEIKKMNQTSRKAFDKLENLWIPVIAGINGLALGGGLELTLCCDFRICSDNAKIALPEINLATIPGGGGTQRLPRLIGPSRAKELLYFGDIINAEEAFSIGLVNKVAEWKELLDTCMDWANKLANKPGVAMRMMKTAMSIGVNSDLSSALTHEAACFEQTFVTADREEGMRAFVEKRKPVYKDK